MSGATLKPEQRAELISQMRACWRRLDPTDHDITAEEALEASLLLATCASELEWLADRVHTEEFVLMLLGYLTGAIPELRQVEAPRMFEAWHAFKREMGKETQARQVPAGCLEVGLSLDELQVVINHPELVPSPGGRGGHILFSPEQANALARLLMEKAAECKR